MCENIKLLSPYLDKPITLKIDDHTWNSVNALPGQIKPRYLRGYKDFILSHRKDLLEAIVPNELNNFKNFRDYKLYTR